MEESQQYTSQESNQEIIIDEKPAAIAGSKPASAEVASKTEKD